MMKHDEITVRVALGRGFAQATVWTCDFSHEYVSINADYGVRRGGRSAARARRYFALHSRATAVPRDLLQRHLLRHGVAVLVAWRDRSASAAANPAAARSSHLYAST